MLLNIFSVMRGIIFTIGDRCKKSFHLFLTEFLFLVSCIIAPPVFFNAKWWVAVLLFIAQAGGTLAMWTRNGKTIRIDQLSFISLLYIISV